LEKKNSCQTLRKDWKNVWRQFHQHFMLAFFVWKQIVQLSLGTFQVCNFWRQNVVQIMRPYKVNEIDSWFT